MSRHRTAQKHPGRYLRGTIALLGSVALLVLTFRLPTRWVPFTICGFKNLTGQDCPGCGMTRGLSALLQGDLTTALAFHPLSPIFLVLMVLLTAWAWFDLSRGSSTLQQMLERRGVPIGAGLAVLVVLSWVIRIGWT
ncbi:hypothetical protein BH23PLA1_BH23PLA1_33940 [soil metagenome]